MSHTIHVAKEPHKKTVIDRNAAKHHDQIADAAYFHAEHRGFKGGDPVADWLAAEDEINAALDKAAIISAH